MLRLLAPRTKTRLMLRSLIAQLTRLENLWIRLGPPSLSLSVSTMKMLTSSSKVDQSKCTFLKEFESCPFYYVIDYTIDLLP